MFIGRGLANVVASGSPVTGVLSGLAAGIAGILINSRVATGDPTSGMGFEFAVIVAVVLGGTAISGGQGTIIGSIVGVLIVGVLDNGLNLMGVSTFYQNIVEGVVLIFAVGVDEAFRRTWRSVLRTPGGKLMLDWHRTVKVVPPISPCPGSVSARRHSATSWRRSRTPTPSR